MQHLDQAREELRQIRTHLEDIVVQRTSELGDALQRDHALLDNLRQIIFIVDEHNQVEMLAGNVIGITGYSIQETLSQRNALRQLLIDEESRARIYALCERVRAGMSPGSVIVPLTDRAGEVRTVQFSLMPLPGKPDEPMRIQGIVEDVSDQQRIEQAIQSLNQASSVVQQASLSNVQVLNALTTALSSLGFASVVFQLEPNDIVRVVALDFDALALQAIEQSLGKPLKGSYMALAEVPIFTRLAAHHEPQRFVTIERYWREILPSGSPGLVQALMHVAPALQGIALPMVADGQLQGILMVLAETLPAPLRPALTTFANQAAIAMRNAQLVGELAEREQQYRSIFESSPSGLLVADGHGRILRANPAVCTLYRVEPIDLVGRQLQELLIDEDVDLIRSLLAALEEDKPWQGQGTGRGHERPPFAAEIHSSSVWYQGVRHALVVLDDITERVQARAALVRDEKLRALGQMAGGIAHDFNNILVGIRGFADLALLDMNENRDLLRQDLDHILRGANDAAEAVRRLQSLYRETGDTSDFDPQDLDTLVNETLALTQPRWKDQPQASGLTIQVHRRLTSPPAVLGNGSELRRVLTNLIVNAVEAMPQGGVLEIETSQISGSSVLRIQDSGLGIPEDQIHTIFEPFFSTKKSSGLGLAIAQTIIERHGGSIEVQSAVGRGTCFEICLPWHQQAPAEPAADTEFSLLGAQLRVLVVDDEEAVRGLLARFLTRAGHGVVLAGSGQEALDKLRAQPFDLLITDLGMPNVSGYEVVSVAHELHPRMPIILSTGWGESITPDKLHALHAIALLAKPFSHQDVESALLKALGEA